MHGCPAAIVERAREQGYDALPKGPLTILMEHQQKSRKTLDSHGDVIYYELRLAQWGNPCGYPKEMSVH